MENKVIIKQLLHTDYQKNRCRYIMANNKKRSELHARALKVYRELCTEANELIKSIK